ncbi:hypothetical protein NP493_259g03004 [Ridgeia piscesae]|uniref:Uncharacterized protein n=1 Tax=Ridgeia piscesae TaxID=27915 RepID=A0AAD9NY56_RIDPI|nr:hypothetical protein NP493_259g03004 [Ridgeia piscesae]
MKMKLKQLMASTLPRARKNKKKASLSQQSTDPSGQTTLPHDFAKQHDSNPPESAALEPARPLPKETCTAEQRHLAIAPGGVSVYNSLPLNVTLNISVSNKDDPGCYPNNNNVEYPQSDDYYPHYLASPEGIYNTVPRTRTGIRTNPWLPSPRASPATSPAVSATTSPTCPGMTLFFGDESTPKSRRFQDAPATVTSFRRHSVEWDTEPDSPMQISMTSDIGSSIATTERVESPFSVDGDASEKLFSSGNDISNDISLRPECDQVMMDPRDSNESTEFVPAADVSDPQSTEDTKPTCPPKNATSERDVDLFVQETPTLTTLPCDDVVDAEHILLGNEGDANKTDPSGDIEISDATVDETNTKRRSLFISDDDCSGATDTCNSIPEDRTVSLCISQLSPTNSTTETGVKIGQQSREQMPRFLVNQTRSLDEIRSSLQEKVMRLRREKLLVDEKVRQAQDEDRIRRQEKLRMQRQLTSYRKHVMLRTLHELRAQLERQTERLQATYSDVLDARWTNSCRRSRARVRGSDVTRERRHSQ